MKAWPNRIRELRSLAGLTLQALADRLDTSIGQISDLETGRRELRLPWMKRIAAELGCSTADLLNPEDNPNSLSPDERGLVERYRGAGPEQRAQLLRMAEIIAPAPPAPSDLGAARRRRAAG
ncbi:MAG TPA: helix-turn-helix transcriptional regulator [Allosphingosinicella sp.]|nr:helix-turn-helix transcriptional regulator [Allosphingosinicella sp.]